MTTLTPAHVPTQSFVPSSRAVVTSASMANSVRIAAAQMTSVNDLSANFATCSRLVKEAVAAGAKLLCFPENFSYVGAKSGDSVTVAEPLDGPIMKKYCSLARESNIWLSLGGFQEKGSDDSHLCNTHVLIDDVGNIRSTYRKMHMFDVDVPGGAVYKESSFTDAGKDIVAVDSPFGRLGLTVCYDLRFPELYQQLRYRHDAQVLLVPSAFTVVTGQAHWEILLRARAIETQCYVIAAAQAGKHSDSRESYGDTLIIDPWGTVIGRLSDRTATGIAVADIDFQLIDSVRSKMPIAQTREKSVPWEPIEDVALMSAWVSVGGDPNVGINHKVDALWEKILKIFEQSRAENPGKLSARTVEGMRARWRLLNIKVNKWIGIYKEAFRRKTSGMSMADVEKEAHMIYNKKKGFPHTLVFEKVMRHHPKWELKLSGECTRPHPNEQESEEEGHDSSKRSRTDNDDTTESTPETPVNSASTINRPTCRDAAKAKRKGKGVAQRLTTIPTEYITEVHAMNITREKELESMNERLKMERRKVHANLLSVLLGKAILSPQEEQLKNRLMGEFL